MSCRSSTIDGFNAYIEKLELNEGETRVTLTLFGSSRTIFFERRPIAAIQPLTVETYCPRGKTALLDAIGETLERVRASIDSAAEK